MSDIFDADDGKTIDLPSTEIEFGRGDRSPLQIALVERRVMALELRKQGGTYRAIAEAIREAYPETLGNYTQQMAHSDVTASLQELIKIQHSTAEEVRQLLYEQLTEMIATYYPRATERGDYFAADRVFAAMDRIIGIYGLAKINFGMDALIKDVDMNKLTTEQLERVALGEPLMKVLLDGPITAGSTATSESGALTTAAVGSDGHAGTNGEQVPGVHP